MLSVRLSNVIPRYVGVESFLIRFPLNTTFLPCLVILLLLRFDKRLCFFLHYPFLIFVRSLKKRIVWDPSPFLFSSFPNTVLQRRQRSTIAVFPISFFSPRIVRGSLLREFLCKKLMTKIFLIKHDNENQT